MLPRQGGGENRPSLRGEKKERVPPRAQRSHKESIEALETQLVEYKELLEKQEINFELPRPESVKTLRPPSLPHFSGKVNLVGEDIFERWVENFEERARIAGWTEEEREYRPWIKLHCKLTKGYPRELW